MNTRFTISQQQMIINLLPEQYRRLYDTISIEMIDSKSIYLKARYKPTGEFIEDQLPNMWNNEIRLGLIKINYENGINK